ncbi:VIT family protein [candidate division SR1 bacterium Aalborg_AAW-1]|nr:VIT family protein [candidate division SR1 bacterium Aalborg_AAW-1]
MSDNQLLSKNEKMLKNISGYIGEVVYGGIDGIVTTFAVVAGFVGAGASATLGDIGPLAVVLFGLANLFGDGVSMGLGKYLSTKSEQDIYHREWNNEKVATTEYHEKKYTDTVAILMEQGVEQIEAEQMTDIMVKHPELWIKWQMDNVVGMPDVRDEKPIAQGLITLFSFIVFGAIPLIPYIFLGEGYDYWTISLVMTGGSLILLGIVRWYITKMNFIGTVAQMVVLGTVAAAVAYWTGDIVMKLQ